MAKAFVTGSAGFIGRHFLGQSELKKRYSSVVCPVKDPEAMKQFFPDEKIVFFKSDISRRDSFDSMIEGCEAVFHFAAKALSKNERDVIGSNRTGTKNIVSAAVKSGTVKKIVYLSTIWAVDRRGGDDFSHPLDEKSEPFPRSVYGKTKLEGENFIKDSGIPYVILRLPPVYGPGSNPDYFVMKFISGIEKGSFIYKFPYPGTVSLAYVKDVANACLIAADNSSLDFKTLFFSTGAPVKVYNIEEKIMELLKIEKKRSSLQVFSADMLKTIFSSFLGRIIVPVKARTLFTDYLVCDSGEFERLSGYKPKISLKEGLTETIEWYREKMPN